MCSLLSDNDLYVRYYLLIENRVQIVNQTLGCNYVSSPENPCGLYRSHGLCYVEFAGNEICRWHMWDVEEVKQALEYMNVWREAVWIMHCAGYVKMVTNNYIERCNNLLANICPA